MSESEFLGAFDTPAIRETMRRRREYEANQKYVVEKIFPAGAMHLLGGPSGVGKTTWLLQQLHDWEQDLPLFGGYRSYSCPWVYIACDRAIRELTQTLNRLGYSKWEFEAYSLEDLLHSNGNGLESPSLTRHVLSRFRHAELIVIEGLQALMPNVPRGMAQNKAELLWAMEARKILGPENRTIIATTHSVKSNETLAQSANNSKNDRLSFLGSAGFIGSCSTMISFEGDDEGDSRIVKIMGRNFKSLRLAYTLDEHGKFMLDGIGREKIENDGDVRLKFITWMAFTKEFTMNDCVKWGNENGWSKATIHRKVNEFIMEGAVRATDRYSEGNRRGPKAIILQYVPKVPGEGPSGPS